MGNVDNGAVAPKTEAPTTPVTPEAPVQTPDVDGNTPAYGSESSTTWADGTIYTEVYRGNMSDRPPINW